MQNIQEIIKIISEGHGLREALPDRLFIKYDENDKEADFFQYIFTEELENDGFYEDESKNLGKAKMQNSESLLGDIDSFDKNLNLVIFYKLDDIKKWGENLKKKIYTIEKNPYNSNKFVFVYTQSQLNCINKESIDILKVIKNEKGELKTLFEKIEKDKQNIFQKENFIFNLISTLHFIKINFHDTFDLQSDLYTQAYGKIDSDFKKNIQENVYKTIDINYTSPETTENEDDNLTAFEKQLLGLGKLLGITSDAYIIEETLVDFLKNNPQKNDTI